MSDGVNVRDYKDKKAKGLIVLAKIGNAFAMSVSRFNVDTGEAAEPQIVGISMEQLEAQKQTLLDSAGDIDDMIADLNALI